MPRLFNRVNTHQTSDIDPDAVALLEERKECAADVDSAANTLASTVARYNEINRQLGYSSGCGALLKPHKDHGVFEPPDTDVKGRTRHDERLPTIIRPCTVAEMEHAPNLAELLTEYAQESAVQELGPPVVQLETYRQMEAAGVLYLLGAFQADSLVGFMLMVVSVLPHFGQVAASSEAFFVASAAREGGTGLKLLQEAEALAAKLGAVGLFISAPMGGRLAQVLPRQKYRETDRVFFRRLAPSGKQSTFYH